MAFPTSHKTVFVLDHGPEFLESSESPIEFDVSKLRGPGVIPLAPISKSLWTCSVESALEYCRIVWDIFPVGRLIRCLICDSTTQTLNSWSQQQQNLTNLMNLMANVGLPESIVTEKYGEAGVQTALEILCECTPIQHEKRTSLVDGSPKVVNRGRVIVITRLADNKQLGQLKEFFQRQLVQQNRIASASDHLLPIQHCDLVIIHSHPNNSETTITPHGTQELSSVLTCEVHCAWASGYLSNKLASLVLRHYDLASTTVTGIPMKEEQNANSSANYDVEIFHSSVAHAGLLKSNAADAALIRSIKENAERETVTLKWLTPKAGSPVEMHHCITVYRMTPVDVNSRPSSCLTNFLLNGRSVLLEMPRKAGGKVSSHMLAAHGGELFIHTLGMGRSTLEDPPSISEGCGGRVTDYRITDFCELMKRNRVAPYRSLEVTNPLGNMCAQLERSTAYWPLTISSTMLFNVQNGVLDSLFARMQKSVLTEDDIIECKKAIYTLMTMENRGEPLPSQGQGQRGKGPKRDEQYRALFTEVETFLQAHDRSDGHHKVLDCLLESRNKPTEEKKQEERLELEQALRELDRLGKTADKKGESGLKPFVRALLDSPMSPPPVKRRALFSGAPSSLLNYWTKRVHTEQQHHTEFIGREGGPAQLYASLKKDKEEV